MGTIREMVYRLWRKLENGDVPDDTKYTYRELKGYVKSGIAEGMKISYFEQRNLEDFKYGDDGVSFSYKADVDTDPDTDEKFVTLQGKSISVAGNRFTSVTSGNPSSRWNIDYIPIRSEELFVRKKQPKIPCVVLFYKQDGKLKFFNEDSRDKTVTITEKYSLPNDDDANLTLPDEFENKAIAIALQLITGVMLPSDRQNDGVPSI